MPRPLPDSALHRSETRPLRMLIVEDDQDLAQIVGRVAGGVDDAIEVDLAPSADRARQLLARERYAFVLVDNYLEEGARGIDLITLVRATQPEAGVAMMSSMDLASLVELTAHERAVQILPKPFSAQLLRAFLHDVLAPFCGRTQDAARPI